MAEILAKLSDQAPIGDVLGPELFPCIVTPDSPTDPHVINAAALAFSTAMFNAFKDHLEATLSAGAGIAPLSIDPVTGLMTLTATGGGGSWDAELTRDTMAAALVGTLGRVIVTPNDAGDLVELDLDPALVADIDAIKASRSLIQAKENAASGGGGNFMLSPGGAGNWIDTPNNAAFNVAGDVGFIFRYKMPSSTPGADIQLVARWASTPLAQFRIILRTTGQLQWVSTVDGTTINSPTTTAATPLAFDGNWLWFRVSRQSASPGNVDFYTAPDTGSDNLLPASFNVFQLNRATVGGALWNNAGALSVPLSILSFNAGGTSSAGSMGRVLMYSNEIGTGTPIADANAADYVSGSTWTGPQGNVWTLHGTASVTLVGGGATSNTSTKFVLADTDANPLITLAHRDLGYWSARGGLFVTVGTSRTFTFELVVNNVVLSTFDPITIVSTAAGTVYRWECSLTIEINSTDGTTQDYQWTLRIYDAKTGTFVGSSSTSAVVFDVGGGNSLALSTYVTLPKIELKLTMAAPIATTVGAGAALSRISLQKA